MPDLITHIATTTPFIFNKKTEKYLIFLSIGAMLPDIFGVMLLVLFDQSWLLENFLLTFHTPFACFFIALLLSFLFEEKQRSKIFLAIFLGTLLHFFFDLWQISPGSRFWILFPFSFQGFSFDFFWSDDFINFLPITLGLMALIFSIRFLKGILRGRTW